MQNVPLNTIVFDKVIPGIVAMLCLYSVAMNYQWIIASCIVYLMYKISQGS